ncbi:MAG: helix-turn-helix domain-containing protein [Bacilli bacterium]|nr:helix-turn-helix domain-containing protein [Bacilli bacterium]
MKELGSYLKNTRIEHGVSLEEAAEDLELSVAQLENIECGNTRAFKDVYKLKNYIKKYAKYLGLNPDKVIDEFNEFLFEHTSKISLADIMEAKRKADIKENVKKVRSPYTVIKKRQINYFPIVVWLLIIFLVLMISYFVVKSINKEPIRDTELKADCSLEGLYEFTY